MITCVETSKFQYVCLCDIIQYTLSIVVSVRWYYVNGKEGRGFLLVIEDTFMYTQMYSLSQI